MIVMLQSQIRTGLVTFHRLGLIFVLFSFFFLRKLNLLVCLVSDKKRKEATGYDISIEALSAHQAKSCSLTELLRSLLNKTQRTALILVLRFTVSRYLVVLHAEENQKRMKEYFFTGMW